MRKKFADIMEWYLHRMQLFGLSISDQKIKHYVGKRLVEEMGNKYLSQGVLKGVPRLKRQDVRKFRASLEQQGLKDTTIQRYVLVGCTVIKTVNRENDWDLPNPFSDMIHGLVYEPREREITGDEQTALLFGLSEIYRDILLVMLDTGMRGGEVINLTWGRVDIEGGWALFGKMDNKSRKPRRAALSDRAIEIIRKQPKGHDRVFTRKGDIVRYQGFIKAFHKARKAANIEHCTPHDFRRTFGYRRRRDEVPLDWLQKQLGHQSIVTTEKIYAKLDDDKARGAVISHGKAL